MRGIAFAVGTALMVSAAVLFAVGTSHDASYIFARRVLTGRRRSALTGAFLLGAVLALVSVLSA